VSGNSDGASVETPQEPGDEAGIRGVEQKHWLARGNMLLEIGADDARVSLEIAVAASTFDGLAVLQVDVSQARSILCDPLLEQARPIARCLHRGTIAALR
jgi:hypothetical protein